MRSTECPSLQMKACMENLRGMFVHPFVMIILARKLSLSDQKCTRREVSRGGTQQPIRVLLYVAKTVARWRYQLLHDGHKTIICDILTGFLGLDDIFTSVRQ